MENESTYRIDLVNHLASQIDIYLIENLLPHLEQTLDWNMVQCVYALRKLDYLQEALECIQEPLHPYFPIVIRPHEEAHTLGVFRRTEALSEKHPWNHFGLMIALYKHLAICVEHGFDSKDATKWKIFIELTTKTTLGEIYGKLFGDNCTDILEFLGYAEPETHSKIFAQFSAPRE